MSTIYELAEEEWENDVVGAYLYGVDDGEAKGILKGETKGVAKGEVSLAKFLLQKGLQPDWIAEYATITKSPNLAPLIDANNT